MPISLYVLSVILFFIFHMSSVNALHQSKLHRINLKGHKSHFLRRLKRFSVVSGNKSKILNDTVYNYEDSRYYIKLTIGSNNQTFLVIADTGSHVTWVPDHNCASSTCTKKHRFRNSSSNSYRPISKRFRLRYGTGNASGIFGADTIGVGSPPAFVVPNCPFGQANQMADYFGSLPELDGIFGLAPIAYSGIGSPWMYAYLQGILPQQLFTVYFEKDGENANGTHGGVITWGEIDTINCLDNVEYVPLLTSDGRWAFNITTICYQEYCNDEVVKAITDSGTSLLYGPAEIVSEILAKIGVDETDGTIPCNVDIKPLVLKIGTKEYQLPKEQFIKNQAGVCSPILQGVHDQDYWLLGDPFVQEYCQIHDLGKSRIGFARSKHREIGPN